MDVKDYSQGLAEARARYRDAQNELKESYDKNTDDLKNTYENKLKKQRDSYDVQKTSMAEQNSINEDRYNETTKKVIKESQNQFLDKLKDNRSTLEEERARDRQTASEKLSHLRNEYERSTLENGRLHDVAMKNLKERYGKNLESSEKVFNNQIKNVDERSREQFDKNRLESRKNLEQLGRTKDSEINNLRAAGVEDRSKLLNRLKEDNESQRTSFESDLKNLQNQQESRVSDLMASKIEEGERNQENFSNLQAQIKKRNAYDQEKIQKEHIADAKVREKRFNDDLKNVQRLADQKINGKSGGVYGGKSEQDRISQSYEDKLFRLKEEMKNQGEQSVVKEQKVDSEYREKMSLMKEQNVARFEDHDKRMNKDFNSSLETIKNKNEENLETIRKNNFKTIADKEETIYEVSKDAKRSMDAQRVEFGKVVNSMNEKNMETLSSLKDDFAKDKSQYIEKSKRDYNQDLTELKSDYQKQIELKDLANDKKMSELQKQANKMIESYENKISQIERKANKEIESLKVNEEERKAKENQSRQLELNMIAASHDTEVKQLRDKYERMIYRDRSETEKMVNKIVQKYEDQLSRERLESQKEKNLKLSEAQANLERLYKAAELEKSTLRQQYEDRINTKDS